MDKPKPGGIGKAGVIAYSDAFLSGPRNRAGTDAAKAGPAPKGQSAPKKRRGGPAK
jgi:hypothetical protein